LRRRYIWLFILIGYCALIFVFTAMPVFNDAHSMGFFLWSGLPVKLADTIDFIVRKLAHVTLFAGLALVALQTIKPSRWDYVLAWVFATLYGASDEWHQLYVIGRTGSIRDVGINSCGALLILLVLYIVEKVIHKKSSH
jgi:VanZ family protein